MSNFNEQYDLNNNMAPVVGEQETGNSSTTITNSSILASSHLYGTYNYAIDEDNEDEDNDNGWNDWHDDTYKPQLCRGITFEYVCNFCEKHFTAYGPYATHSDEECVEIQSIKRYETRSEMLAFIEGNILNYDNYTEKNISQIKQEKKQSKKRNVLEDPMWAREVLQYVGYVSDAYIARFRNI